jgi:hypothetical protein
MVKAAQEIIFQLPENLIYGSDVDICQVSLSEGLSKGILRTFGEDWAMIGTSLPDARACARGLRQVINRRTHSNKCIYPESEFQQYHVNWQRFSIYSSITRARGERKRNAEFGLILKSISH